MRAISAHVFSIRGRRRRTGCAAICAAVSAFIVAFGQLSVAGQSPVVERNVNMVSGTGWPSGDPFLQRQNEPSIAVSTRNPSHLLAGANDYRTVDLPGLPHGELTGDAWLGLFKSFDGGQTWTSTLLPGYPQDKSSEGRASPLYGFDAAADPVVRAGTNGLFYYAGIAFHRDAIAPNTTGKDDDEDDDDRGETGALFVARFIDDNNKENGDPIRSLGSVIVADADQGKFIDKPWLAVDIPRGGNHCGIAGQNGPVPAGNVYVAFAVFKNTDPIARSKILFARSSDCGATWKLQKLGQGNRINQGASIAIDPKTGDVYVAWRRFASSDRPNDLIIIAKSTDGGGSFTSRAVVNLPKIATRDGTMVSGFFDQGATAASFRTTAFPTVAVDGEGRVYLAWSQRGAGSGGDARVMLMTSRDGLTWTSPRAVNNPPVKSLEAPSNRGHQIMPALTFGAGRMMLAYYSLVEDHTSGRLTPTGEERREPAGDLAPLPGQPDMVFKDFIEDAPDRRRHTLDVRIGQALPADRPEFIVTRASQYAFGSRPHSPVIEQFQYNPPNFPLFGQGTKAFIGDYIDVATAPPFVQSSDSAWTFNTAFSTSAVHHVAWTDNRDVRPPTDKDWTRYTPPFVPSLSPQSLFDPSLPRPVCEPGRTGMRNQNIYTTRVSNGLIVGARGNAKPLLPDIQRAFAVTVQNSTEGAKTFQLRIENQPPEGTASFLQFALVESLDVVVPRRSSVSRSIFVTSTQPHASVRVNVQEIADVFSGPIPPESGGLQGTVVLNPDITNPDITNPDITNPDITNPDITNAEVYNPDITNPDITNPAIRNPVVKNPDITNPDITNPDITNPDITNPDITNPDITNPDITNPDITNKAITDASWVITNKGNTTASYDVKLLLNGKVPDDLRTQLVIHKIYTTPVATPDPITGQPTCSLGLQTQNILVVNVFDPVFASADGTTAPDITNPDLTSATVTLAPGETARATLRIVDRDPTSGTTASALVQQVATAVVSQSVNSDDAANGITQPPVASSALLINTSALPSAIVGSPYAHQLRASGNVGTLAWATVAGALPPDLVLDSSGLVYGTPTTTGTFSFVVQAQDSSSSSVARRALTIVVTAAGRASLSFVTQPSNARAGSRIVPVVSVRAVNDRGEPVPAIEVRVELSANPGGALLSGTTTGITNSTGVAFFPAVSVANAANGYTLVATADTFEPDTSIPFTVGAAIADSLPAPVAVAPAPNTVIAQNNPSIACPPHISRGSGYRIDFDWTSVASANGPVTYRLVLKRRQDAAPLFETNADDSAFSLVSCNAFVADDALDGWEWRVRATDAAGVVSPFSVAGVLRFAPCRLSNGETCSGTERSIEFVTQPSDAATGEPITPAVQVLVREASGTPAGQRAVTLGAVGLTNGTVIGGATAVTGANGIASFGALEISKAATGLKLVASGPGLPAATSAPFNVIGATGAACTVPAFTLRPPISTWPPNLPDPMNANPRAVAVGDFNGDGVRDLAIANSGQNNVAILFGLGDGAFTAAVTFETGSEPVALAAADFDRNGTTDLIVANFASDSLTILSGDGAGGFASTSIAGLPAGPRMVIAADFNGDGWLDLAVASQTAGAVSILPNSGSGTAGSASSFASGIGTVALVASDFNGDGRVDLAVVNGTPSEVRIFTGSGDGTFVETGGPFPVGQNPSAIAAGDFNGDGHRDLAIAALDSHDVTILLNDGSGGLGPAASVDVGSPARAIVTGDFNGDGALDVAAATADDVVVLLGAGNGTFQPVLHTNAGADATALAMTDVNGDGKADLAVVFGSAGQAAALVNVCGAPPDLVVTVTDSPDPVAVNTPLRFVAVVKNQGAGVATNVKLDVVPLPGAVFKSASPDVCIQGADTITCTLGTLNPGSSGTFTITRP